MDRRNFLRLAGTASAGLALPRAISSAFAADDGWRTYEVVTQVEILKPEGATRVWLPALMPVDTPYQKFQDSRFDAPGGTATAGSVGPYGVAVVSAQWPAGVAPVLTHTQRFATRDVAVDLSKPGNAPAEDPAVLARYTQATDHIPTTGLVKDMSSDMVKGANTDVEKARAIYEWIVENTWREPTTKGCGLGDVKFMLENKLWGGKCADLNGLFIAFARAQGVPARDVYGVRVADSKLGYKSLGKAGDITKAQHCRAEFYAVGYGWVPVDPADVRKVILEESGGKKIDDPMVVAARKRLFGSWEMNWLAYNTGSDVALPGSVRSKVNYLMYPQAETVLGRLDSLDPDNFKYTIKSREIA